MRKCKTTLLYSLRVIHFSQTNIALLVHVYTNTLIYKCIIKSTLDISMSFAVTLFCFIMTRNQWRLLRCDSEVILDGVMVTLMLSPNISMGGVERASMSDTNCASLVVATGDWA